MLRWLLAAFHLLALALGYGAIWARARAMEGLPQPTYLRRTLLADNWWGLASLLWLGTGLARLFLGTEKPTAYYWANTLFWVKVACLVLILLLELPQMVDLIKWRIVQQKGGAPDLSRGPRWVRLSRVQAWLVLLVLFVATGMARGYGMR